MPESEFFRMRRSKRFLGNFGLCSAFLLMLGLVCGPVFAQAKKPQGVDEFLADMGAQSIRAVHIDICFPATSEEYEAVGKALPVAGDG